jgi:hypothetical protein
MQARELVAGSLGENFHSAVVIIANPSGDAEDVRLALNEPAKSHALHASAHHKAASFNGFFSESHAVVQGFNVSRFQSFKEYYFGLNILVKTKGNPAFMISREGRAQFRPNQNAISL